VEVPPLLLGLYDVVSGGSRCGIFTGWVGYVGTCALMVGEGGTMNGG
jgi:hypothetical protein